MNEVKCKVLSIEPLTPYVHKVILQPAKEVVFLPGQYLMLHLSEQDKRAFSIACHSGAKELELHIGVGRPDSYAGEAMTYLQEHPEVTISIPMGNAYWHPERHEPTILMAGGTGFSYVKSILTSMANQPRRDPLHVYWGVRKAADLYELNQLEQLATEHHWLKIHTVVEEPTSDWNGLTGKVHEAVLGDFDNFIDYDIYMAGRFEMVGLARDAFMAKGARREAMFSDAFAFID